MKNTTKKHHYTDKELSRLCLELSYFLRSGTAPGTGLLFMSEKNGNPATARRLREMSDAVGAGVSLSQAAEDSDIFPKDAVAMIKIGETTGRTEEAVASLAAYYSSRDRITDRVRSALLYPTVLLAVMLGVVILLLTKVLPVFEEVYASVGGTLTGAAGVLLTLGQALRRGLPLIAALLAAGAAAVLLLLKKGILQKCFRNNKIAVQYRTARFAKALHMAIASGLFPEDAVATAGQLMQRANGKADGAADGTEERQIAHCLRLLDEGIALADAMAQTKLLPPSDCRLLGLALVNGAVEDAAREIAEQAEADADAALEQWISRIEPALVLIASLLVGGILLCVMVPLVGLMTALG